MLEVESDWELTSVDKARVVAVDDRFVMIYSGRTITDRGLAVSDDGVNWTRVGDDPAMTKSDHPVATSESWDSQMIERSGMLYLYLEVGFISTGTGTQIYLATAPVP